MPRAVSAAAPGGCLGAHRDGGAEAAAQGVRGQALGCGSRSARSARSARRQTVHGHGAARRGDLPCRPAPGGPQCGAGEARRERRPRLRQGLGRTEGRAVRASTRRISRPGIQARSGYRWAASVPAEGGDVRPRLIPAGRLGPGSAEPLGSMTALRHRAACESARAWRDVSSESATYGGDLREQSHLTLMWAPQRCRRQRRSPGRRTSPSHGPTSERRAPQSRARPGRRRRPGPLRRQTHRAPRQAADRPGDAGACPGHRRTPPRSARPPQRSCRPGTGS